MGNIYIRTGGIGCAFLVTVPCTAGRITETRLNAGARAAEGAGPAPRLIAIIRLQCGATGTAAA